MSSKQWQANNKRWIGLLLALLCVAGIGSGARAALASSICACYHGDYNTCDYSFADENGVAFESDGECVLYCEDTYGAELNDEAYSDDSDSDTGIAVGADCNEATDTANAMASANAYIPPEAPYATPQLSVKIPGLTFTQILKNSNGNLKINYIGEYVSAVYNYLLTIAVTIAIVFVMIGGFQYVLAGSSGDTTKAKQRIRNAVTGLVLLLCAYIILYTVNPNLTQFQELTVQAIEERLVDFSTAGAEGTEPASLTGGIAATGDWCNDVLAQAQSQGTCNMTGTERFISPTGGAPGCGSHHWSTNYQEVKNLDFPAGWGFAIRAPFSGTVTYKKRTEADNRCGNTITLEGQGAKIYICHAKDFVDDEGVFENGRQVKQGEVLGHLGGACCSGEVLPDAWLAQNQTPAAGTKAVTGSCNVQGTMCTDPTKAESCSCQPVEQAGNTTGPHVHVSWVTGGNFLACLDTSDTGGSQ